MPNENGILVEPMFYEVEIKDLPKSWFAKSGYKAYPLFIIKSIIYGALGTEGMVHCRLTIISLLSGNYVV